MTLAHPEYLAVTRRGLAAIAPPLHHFCLVAPLDTIAARLRARDTDTAWTTPRARRYVPLFADPRYARHVATESRTVDEIVAEILQYVAEAPPEAALPDPCGPEGRDA